MPANNFKLFDENKQNMLSDQEYQASQQRLGGVQAGIASSMLNNKFAYQMSLIAYAIAQMMNANGYDATDALAVSAFVGNLSSSVLQKVIDKATTAEAQAGTNTLKWMTPALVKSFYTYMVATESMAVAGTDTTHWMTPALVKKMIDTFTCKAIFNVYAENGNVVTMTKGAKALTATVTNNIATLYPAELGTWSVKVGSLTAANVTIDTISIIDWSPYTFSNASWTLINKLGQLGIHKKLFNVGDYKTYTNGGTYIVEIADFEHDTLVAGGLAPYTFCMRECYAAAYPMNSTATNAGGWASSKMRTTNINNVLTSMQADMKAIMKPVKKLTSKGSKSNEIVTTNDTFWLLSEVEVFGAVTYSVPGEGRLYPIFTDSASRIKKFGPAGAVSSWWLRSPNVNNDFAFCFVNTNGGPNASRTADSSLGVCLGFCA